MRSSALHSLCVCALVGLAACDDDPTTPVTGKEVPPAWTELTGFPSAVTLYALWAPREDYAIGVGPRGLILRWDGLQWATITNTGLRSLYAVAGATGGEIVAAGDRGEIVRFTGTQFEPVPTPTPENLRALWTPDGDAFIAVGDEGVILRGDGVAWTRDDSPVTDPLFGVWGSGADDVFAVGLNGVILHNDGNAWTPMTSGTTALLAAVSGKGPDDVYAVGQAGVVLHFDGAAWTPMATGSQELLQSVVAGERTVAVGSNGVVLELANAVWSRAYDAAPAWLYAAAQAGTTTWVAGARAIIVRDGTGWHTQTRGAVPALNGIAGPPSAPLRVVGENGYVAREAGGRWIAEESGDTRPLNTVWCAPDGDVFAVGRNRIARHDGLSWIDEFTSLGDLYDINGGPAGTHAVGVTGAIYRRSEGVWTIVRPTTPVFDDLHAFVGVADDEAYIVGNDGRILSFNGFAWTAATPVVPADLFDIAITPPGSSHRVVAVGESGTIIGLTSPPTPKWEVLDGPTNARLAALAGGPGGRLYAVGQSGVVIAYDGSVWTIVPSPTLKTLRSAWSDGENLFVVGGEQSSGPVLLRYGAP